MKIIKNSIIPFEGFAAMNLFGILFVRKEYADRCEGTEKYDLMINHESIHTEQQKDLLYIFFYIWYVIEWFLKLFYYFDSDKAYHNISFEREAYANESDMNYISDKRKKFSFLKYI